MEIDFISSLLMISKEMNIPGLIEEEKQKSLQRAQEIDERRNKTADIFRQFIDKLGLEKFSQIFVEYHHDQFYVVDPHEFFQSDEQNEIFEIYQQERKKFDLDFYRRYMPKMDPDQVAKTLGVLADRDIPREVLNGILSENK